MANRIGTSSYSFWHFLPEKVPIEYVMDQARSMGLDAVEILHVQMESEANDYLQSLKRKAYTLGLDIACLAIHQGFVSPDAAERRKNVEHTLHCIELAYQLGAPAIRLNSGRWGTTGSFDALMAVRGQEPALPGYTEEDAHAWVVDCIRQCLPLAAERGVVLALENHWGLTAAPEQVLRIVSDVDSPWLGVTLDCGNFLDDPYRKLAQLARYAVQVHAKTYYGGGVWYSLDLDYGRVAQILREVDFKGYVTLEYEGKEDPLTAVPRSVEMLRQHFG
ncbi:MAG: sugar phosphate isomerase/epimerase family protein [Anaerolineae bacterium]